MSVIPRVFFFLVISSHLSFTIPYMYVYSFTCVCGTFRGAKLILEIRESFTPFNDIYVC